MRRLTLLPILCLLACNDADTPSDPPDASADAALLDAALLDASPDAGPTTAGLVDAPADQPGPLSIARTDFTIEHADRRLPVTLWYPTDAAPGMPQPIDAAFLDGDDATAWRALVDDDSRTHCATTTTATPADAAGIRTDLPLILMSHCHTCTRFNMLRVAEYLASHGFIVAAPDHVGNTLFDELRGASAAVGGPFLLTRGADMIAVLDALLGDALPAPAQAVADRIDPARIGALGHSFGAVTTGWLLENDPRVQAGVAVAAPMENPLVPGVTLSAITQPTLHVVAVEDNSITEVGNTFIRNNFGAIATPTYKLEVADAGHWSFSDLAGITDALTPGCGDGTRQTNREAFTYLQPDAAIPILSAYATAFFRAHLTADPAALTLLTAPPADGLSLEAR